MILLDTSVLIDALTGPRRSGPALRNAIERGERVILSSLVLYEWLRGPRLPGELQAQEALFPAATAPGLGAEEAALAARLYRNASRARGREMDLAIAACALTWEATVWTLNVEDFADIPGLQVTLPFALPSGSIVHPGPSSRAPGGWEPPIGRHQTQPRRG